MMVAYYRAAIASLRGEQDGALEFLEQAWRGGWRRQAQVRTSPLFAGLQGDEHLEVLLGQVRKELDDERLAHAPESGSAALEPTH